MVSTVTCSLVVELSVTAASCSPRRLRKVWLQVHEPAAGRAAAEPLEPEDIDSDICTWTMLGLLLHWMLLGMPPRLLVLTSSLL